MGVRFWVRGLRFRDRSRRHYNAVLFGMTAFRDYKILSAKMIGYPTRGTTFQSPCIVSGFYGLKQSRIDSPTRVYLRLLV